MTPARTPAARLTPARVSSLTLLACLLSSSAAIAGPYVIPGTWAAGGAFQATPDAIPRAVRFAEVDATADGTQARARLVYRLAPGAADVTVLIPLPHGADAKDTRVTLDDAPAPGWFLRPEQAQRVLAALGEATGDTALLADVGRPAWLVPAAELGDRARLTVETAWRLDAIDGMARFALPLPSAGPDGPARLRAALQITAPAARGPLRAVFSPSHEIEVHRPDPQTAVARLTADRGEGEWQVLYAIDPEALGLRVLTHRGDDTDGGTFLLIGNPTGGGDERAPLAKDVVLALDTSGSMRGEKMEQARLAAEQVIARLGPDDRFNIVAFGTDVTALADAPLPRTEANRARAAEFVDALVAHGRTNIADALAAALAGGGERPRIVLFLTDGTPTAGLRDPQQIVDGIPAKGQSRVFVFGVGDDVNAHLLDKIAERTGGQSTYVDPGQAIDVKVAALYDSLSHPVLADVKLDFGGLAVTAVHPDTQPQLFRGQEVLVVGRYTGGGAHVITLSGTVDGVVERHAIRVDFPARARPDNAFVETLWATRRVGELLHRLRLEGNDPETLREVVELSRRHGILTEYTAFLSTDERSYDGAEALGRTAELVERARAQQSGRWAVRQADNEQALRHRKVASTEANVYRDRQGRVQSGDNVRNMAGRAFYKRGDKWVEADDGKQRTTRRVKKFSPEYMKLVEENEDFARAQRLGGDMVFNADDAQVEVY